MKRYSILLILVITACHNAGDEPATSTADVAETKNAAPPPPAAARDSFFALIADTLLTRLYPGDTVHSGPAIAGRARGIFFSEAQFGIQLLDERDSLLAAAPARADGNWMTTGWVPFNCQLSWKNYRGKGRLIFEKDNPSGLPERARRATISVVLVP